MKRKRWYFCKELFSYIIPIILIVGTIDVFYKFMRCPLHPEWSAPCNVNWIYAVIYGVFLIIVITLEIISATMLRKVKKQIEKEFLESTVHAEEKSEKPKENKPTKSKRFITKSDKEESTIKMIKKEDKVKIKRSTTKK